MSSKQPSVELAHGWVDEDGKYHAPGTTVRVSQGLADSLTGAGYVVDTQAGVIDGGTDAPART